MRLNRFSGWSHGHTGRADRFNHFPAGGKTVLLEDDNIWDLECGTDPVLLFLREPS